jgi:DNA topoisomerase-2
MLPYFRGFNGTVVDNGENSFSILGDINVTNLSTIEITSLPIGYDLDGYISVLDKLEEDNIIKSYTDLSNVNTFKFIVKVPRAFTKNNNKMDILNKFKLVKKMVEGCTCGSETLSLNEFKNAEDIFDAYYDIRLDYYVKRKCKQLKEIERDIRISRAKYVFINGYINGDIKLNNVKRDDIVKQLDGIKHIIKVDGSYNYLLNMSISSLTYERYTQLVNKIKELRAGYLTLKSTAVNDIWLAELSELLTVYKREKKNW